MFNSLFPRFHNLELSPAQPSALLSNLETTRVVPPPCRAGSGNVAQDQFILVPLQSGEGVQ